MLLPAVFFAVSIVSLIGGLFLALLASADPGGRSGFVIGFGLVAALGGLVGLLGCMARLVSVIF